MFGEFAVRKDHEKASKVVGNIADYPDDKKQYLKEHLYYYLRRKGQERERTHFMYGEFAVCYAVFTPDAAIDLTKKALVKEGLEFCRAFENQFRECPYVITTYGDLFFGTKAEQPLNNIDIKKILKEKMYIVSNRERCLGSGWILNPEYIRNISDAFGADIAILPYSVHETLVCPLYRGPGVKKYLSWMRTHARNIPQEDRLSDSVYLYTRFDGKLICCRQDRSREIVQFWS